MSKYFKILSIDGGGIKGLYSAKVLSVFEKSFGTNLSDHFDLICGTSTGGLIALAASIGIPMSNVVKFYKEHGNEIFASKLKHFGKLGNVLLGIRQAVCTSKYKQKPLREALEKVFGSRKICESNNLLCIPAYNLTNAQPRIFKRDYKSLDRDNNTSYVDVGLATSAAPTYFPIKEIDNNDYVDGGVFANNPVLVGLTEYMYMWSNKNMFDGVDILSVSSCENSLAWSPKHLRRSFFKWRDNLFDCYSHGQIMTEDFFLKQLKDSLNFDLNIVRVKNAPISSQQEEFIGMDNASKYALKTLEGIGEQTGNIFKEKQEVMNFFTTLKTINPNDYGK